MKPTKKDLQRAANRKLRAHGFLRDGSRCGEISRQQYEFENRLIRIPTGGKPKH